MNSLEGKVAIVTGGNSGIGREVALELARQGARVAVAARREEEGLQTVQQIREIGAEAFFARCDVTVATDVRALVDRTVHTFGRLDCAFNNAGVLVFGPSVVDLSEEDFDRMVGVNVKGTFLCMKYEIPAMLRSGGGAIVNCSSVAALVSHAGQAAYSGTKAAIVGLTRGAALDFASKAVRVNAVCPGTVNTPMMDALFADPNIVAYANSLHPLGRVGTPEDVAPLVAFLLGDKARWITGQAFPIDGGFTVQ
ncbi:SDR family NAD(P)-dependent oxidoreductase [Polyangium aurulentum]|uniref:SDR family NAD(P)-dependent oxidoreductase n=1 Tax=Polyangium aurulentum TaxID=2567896 RepID=UPI0010AE4F50|nr:glucose 1-dehydrogenase [Polyangium aurulentum]UQA56778.1 glucose 1-dehydrogenase [Polyangium aurulentum]